MIDTNNVFLSVSIRREKSHEIYTNVGGTDVAIGVAGTAVGAALPQPATSNRSARVTKIPASHLTPKVHPVCLPDGRKNHKNVALTFGLHLTGIAG